MQIGLVQAPPGMDTAEQYIREAGDNGCRVICFPEAFLTGYDSARVEEYALTVEDEKLQKLSILAQEYEMDVLMGFMEKQQDCFYLTHGIFGADGSVQFYQKTHLGERETGIFTPGSCIQTYTLSCGLQIGFQICMETHFPEITQKLSLEGAEVIFAPFAVPGTPQRRKEIWSIIMPARSYDNRVYMASCNLWDGHHFYGGCMAADPFGAVAAEDFGNGSGLLVFEYEKRKIRMFHEGNPSMKYRYYPAKRRPDLYRTD